MTTPLVSLEAKLLSLQATRDFVNNQIAELYKEMKQQAPSPRNMKNVLFPIVRDFNCSVGEFALNTDIKSIFGVNAIYVKHYEKADIFTLLVDAGAFESKGQARKNWNGVKEIPVGYSEIGPIGKQKLMLFIWNPTE
jgi:hypothetical protein